MSSLSSFRRRAATWDTASHPGKREIKSNHHPRHDCAVRGVTITGHFRDRLTQLSHPPGLSDDVEHRKQQMFAREPASPAYLL